MKMYRYWLQDCIQACATLCEFGEKLIAVKRNWGLLSFSHLSRESSVGNFIEKITPQETGHNLFPIIKRVE